MRIGDVGVIDVRPSSCRTSESCRARWTTGSAATSPPGRPSSSPRPAAPRATCWRSRWCRRRRTCRRADQRIPARAGRRDRGRRRPRQRHPGRRARPGDQARARVGAGARAWLDAQPARIRTAVRRRRAAGIPFTLESLGRATGTDADAIHAAAPASRPAWSRCRCATCTRLSRWSASTTSRRRRS